MTLIWLFEVKMIAAGVPSKVTVVPDPVVASAPFEPTCSSASVAGPMFEPKIRMFRPGERDVGSVLAAFWIATTVGLTTGAGVTVRVIGRVTGELVAPATVIVT